MPNISFWIYNTILFELYAGKALNLVRYKQLDFNENYKVFPKFNDEISSPFFVLDFF